MVLLHQGATLQQQHADCDNSIFGSLSSSRQRLHGKLSMLQLHLELDQDITRFQPPQVSVRDGDDGNNRVVLLTTRDLFWRHQALQQQQQATIGHGGVADLTSESFRGTDFRISERYRCLANPRGQVQGGMGFIYEGIDLAEGTKVAIKFFHKNDDSVVSARINAELATCVRLHHGLHSSGLDDSDLKHLIRLRDVLVNAPLLDDCQNHHGQQPSPMFSATAMVFDWADGGDAHSLMTVGRSVSVGKAADLFRQVLCGLRGLHRRGIVHRDIKPENILLHQESGTASLCDLGFAKHVPSVLPADLTHDPTSCYQSPERWLACHSVPAQRARMNASINASVASGGAYIARRDETPQTLYSSDIFSAGVTFFMLVAYNAILMRVVTERCCDDVDDGHEQTLPAMNVFQPGVSERMFGLLRSDLEVQQQLWTYWESYGLRLPAAVRRLLDGVLHPVPERRFTLNQAFTWMDAHPEIFEEN